MHNASRTLRAAATLALEQAQGGEDAARGVSEADETDEADLSASRPRQQRLAVDEAATNSCAPRSRLRPAARLGEPRAPHNALVRDVRTEPGRQPLTNRPEAPLACPWQRRPPARPARRRGEHPRRRRDRRLGNRDGVGGELRRRRRRRRRAHRGDLASSRGRLCSACAPWHAQRSAIRHRAGGDVLGVQHSPPTGRWLRRRWRARRRTPSRRFRFLASSQRTHLVARHRAAASSCASPASRRPRRARPPRARTAAPCRTARRRRLGGARLKVKLDTASSLSCASSPELSCTLPAWRACS